jgi:formyltetrahydrofolate deformylase
MRIVARSSADTEGFILVTTCPDRKGVVAAVSGFLADNDASITESNHFNDAISGRFYMRTVFRAAGPDMPPADAMERGFELVARRFNMTWSLHPAAARPRVLIAVSKLGHCLVDLLHRWRAGLLPVDVVGVVSNHETLRAFVEWNELPFHHLPIDDRAARPDQEARFLALMEELRADLTVLARYMQILSAEFLQSYGRPIINIHQSFLPAFVGASPYHQAYARGVKIIGATAHYVTAELDAGPIIHQDVAHISHRDGVEDMIRIGREVERRVLAQAVRWHLEDRILVDGVRTVVFA